MTNNLKIFTIVAAFLALFVCADTSSAQTRRKTVGAAEINGTFRDYFDSQNRKSFNEIKIRSTGKGKLKVSFNLIYPDLSAGGGDVGNSGSTDGAAALSGKTATFSPSGFEQCRITIRFVKPGRIEVAQKGNDTDCGFGANVSASGTYKKIGAKPKSKPSK